MKTFYSSVSSWLKAASLTAMAAMLAVNVSAQESTRTYWDFTKPLSQETIDNLKADTQNYTRATEHTDKAEAMCWATAKKGTEDMVGQPIMANGVVIKELEGIVFNDLKSMTANNEYFRLGIQTTKFRNECPELALPTDVNRFRLCRADMSLRFPAMKAGQTITIKWHSAKPAAYSASTADTYNRYLKSDQATIISGAPDDVPEGHWPSYRMYEVTFEVNEDIKEPTPIVITGTGGIDIYTIKIDGGGPVVEKAKNIAYVTAASDFDEIGNLLEGASDQFAVTTIMSDSEVSLDSLQTFEAVVISGLVGVNDNMVKTLRKAVAYVPVLNLNSNLVKEWGLASIVDGPATLTVPEDMTANALFADIDLSEGLAVFTEGNNVPALVLGDYFANDKILALAGENVGIHQHNTYNSYMYLPWRDLATDEAVYSTLVLNAAAVVAETKGNVGTVGKPAFAPTYENMETTVAITSTTGAKIYYTLDGTVPTTESEVYTDPLIFKEVKTIKAFAVRDGYYDSEVAEYTVELKKKAAAPSISLAYADSSTTITMSSDIKDAQIYYTFKRGVTDYKVCAPYTKPVVLTVEPGTVYAFVRETADYVGSDVDSVHVAIKHITKDNIRLDVVSEYSCDEASWKTSPRVANDVSDSRTYYPWGKNAAHSTDIKWDWFYWDYDKVVKEWDEPVLDENGEPVIDETTGQPKTNHKVEYGLHPDRLKYAYPTNETATESAKQWRLYSEGQVLVHEFTNNPFYEYNDGSREGRYFDRPEDMIGNMATKGHLSFKGKPSGAPYCAGIESVVPFDAPFDVVVLAGNAAGKAGNHLDLSLSTDGENWTKVHNIGLSDYKQTIRKDRYSVEEPGKWYVRVGQTEGGNDIHMYNLYILNNGEKSQLYDGQTGIEEIIAGNEAAEVVAVEVYNLNGYRLAKAERGVNIIRTVYADGTVKVEKVIVK